MKWFIFVVLIPMFIGIITSELGVGWFSDVPFMVTFLANVPLCVTSVCLYYTTE